MTGDTTGPVSVVVRSLRRTRGWHTQDALDNWQSVSVPLYSRLQTLPHATCLHPAVRRRFCSL